MESNNSKNPGFLVKHIHERRRRLVPRAVPGNDPYHLLEYNIPGVEKVIISNEAQKVLHCIFGIDLTIQALWKYIDKNLFNEFLNSEFYHIRDKITNYPRERFLVGYIPDDSRDCDEFNICLVEAAEDEITEVIEKVRKTTEDSLNKLVYKKPRRWRSLGSEIEIKAMGDQMNRELLRVEVEADYPYAKVDHIFRLRMVENARDGYVETISARTFFDPVKKKCVDSWAQRSPYTILNEAQTQIKFLRNAGTQYEYKCEKVVKLNWEKVRNFMCKRVADIGDSVVVNGYINFYTQDYKCLILDDRYSREVDLRLTRPYSFLFDNAIGTSKQIAQICFHPMWTGTFAVAYIEHSYSSYRTRDLTFDEVTDAIYNVKAVSLWSFKDHLQPLLLLETPREISSISFCPYDENILVGGCINGQIIVWDIKDKLRCVETEEILTEDRKRYRLILQALITWFKNVKNPKFIRPAIVSDLAYSHTTAVTSISWLPSSKEVSVSGQIRDIPDEDNRTSLQFTTSSHDGSVLIWDLNMQPVFTAGGYKPKRALKRLKKRPSALSESISPLRSLNRIFKPIFKIAIQTPTARNLPLTVALSPSFTVPLYVERFPNPKRKFDIEDRILYDCIHPKPDPSAKVNSLIAGSAEGDFIVGTWEGFAYSSGAAVNEEALKFTNYSRIHDGPIVSLNRSEIDRDIVLSIGGKILALWNARFMGRPFFWKRGECRYTHGAFSLSHPSVFILSRSDGKIECWHLKVRSDRYAFLETTFGTSISMAAFHSLPLLHNVVAISDERSWIKLHYLSNSFKELVKEDSQFFRDFCAREIHRKEQISKWQAEWNAKYRSAQLETEARREEVPEAENTEDAKKVQAARPDAGKALTFEERGAQQWLLSSKERVKTQVLQYKNVDLDLLKKNQIPALLAAEEEAKGKERRDKYLGTSHKVFDDAVDTYFSETLKPKPLPPPDPYAGGDAIEERLEFFKDYQEVSRQSDSYIKSHPYMHHFDWAEMMSTGKARYQTLMGKKAPRRRRGSKDAEEEKGSHWTAPKASNSATDNEEPAELEDQNEIG